MGWNSNLYAVKPGTGDAVSWAKAIGKMIDMGAAMDTKLLKAGADAHHAAIGGLPASGVCSEAQLTAITAAIGRMIASVPESKTMDVYNSVGALVDSSVPAYLMSTVKEADAKAAYAALVDFAGVVKAHPITASTPASTVSGGSIGPAASKLAAAAYPFIKDVDWTSDLALKPPRGDAPDSDEGCRQNDCHGRGHGWCSPQGGCAGPCQGHRGRGWEGCAVAGRLRGNQCRTWEGHCVGTH